MWTEGIGHRGRHACVHVSSPSFAACFSSLSFYVMNLVMDLCSPFITFSSALRSRLDYLYSFWLQLPSRVIAMHNSVFFSLRLVHQWKLKLNG
jgi:hypothetical protein